MATNSDPVAKDKPEVSPMPISLRVESEMLVTTPSNRGHHESLIFTQRRSQWQSVLYAKMVYSSKELRIIAVTTILKDDSCVSLWSSPLLLEAFYFFNSRLALSERLGGVKKLHVDNPQNTCNNSNRNSIHWQPVGSVDSVNNRVIYFLFINVRVIYLFPPRTPKVADGSVQYSAFVLFIGS